RDLVKHTCHNEPLSSPSAVWLRLCRLAADGPPDRHPIARGEPRVFTLRFCALVRPVSELSGDRSGQLEPRTDPKLLVGAAEMTLDRLLGDEQGLREFAVGAPFSSLAAHSPFGCGQCRWPGELDSRAPPGPGL